MFKFHYLRIMKSLILFALFLGIQGKSIDLPKDTNCGYDSCNPLSTEGRINVHLVAHTHDDVGWLKTFDQYFYGKNSNIQYAGVQYILDTVISELQQDPTRRFIYVETAYFWKWWIQQSESTQEIVKSLVNSGQLEFIGGAWSMNDEAAAHYHSIIDQFTWGLRKLNDTFGECGRPKIGWQIDPFGHSKEMASLFAQLGYDGLFLGRIDYQDKNNRFQNQQPEMIWQASQDLGDSSDIFTGVLYNMYQPPPGLCFDVTCQDDPIIDDPESPDYNVDEKLSLLFSFLDNAANVYTTPNILLTMGSDFHYQNARMWYKNLDLLIKYANARNDSNYHLLYSTPSCYLKAVHDDAGDSEWPTKQDDFFPYASDEHSYWTGYFSSRPTSKRFERLGNNFLQVVKQLATIANLDVEEQLDSLREAMGVLQHHDAITGTEKQHVANDYARILHSAITKTHQIASDALNILTVDKQADLDFQSCLLLNISSCPVTENNDNFVVAVYNPLSYTNIFQVVHLPVTGENYEVSDVNGTVLASQLHPISDYILEIPGRESDATAELWFTVRGIPPLGFRYFHVRRIDGNRILKTSNALEVSFDHIGLILDEETGLLSKVRIDDSIIAYTTYLAQYTGFIGDNTSPDQRSSGAYVFRPNGPKVPLDNNRVIENKIYDGPLVKEIHQTFSDYAHQVIRIHRDSYQIDTNYGFGPIPDDLEFGIEALVVLEANLTNNGQFFTDSNGRQTLDRTLNERPTWQLNLSEPVSGNYYPVTSKIGFSDQELGLRFTTLTDRAQGGSSLEEGQLELLVYRRCLHDDQFGVGEALNEHQFGEGVAVVGVERLLIQYNDHYANGLSAADTENILAQQFLLQPWYFIAPITDEANIPQSEFAGLIEDLPQNVKLLTLEPWKDGTVLIRLEHILENNPQSSLGQPVTVDLANVFTTFDVVSLRETTLGANQWLDENERLLFNSQQPKSEKFIRAPLVGTEVTLNPMEIRTFVAEINRHED